MPRSPLDRDRWYRTAAVRARPPRQLADDEAHGRLFYSTAQIPVAAHRLVQGRLDERSWQRLHAQHLQRFMAFTTRLEHYVVNPVVAAIAHRALPVEVRAEDMHDAYRIYVDEGYHALAAADLIREVASATGVQPIAVPGTRIDERVDRLLVSLPDARLRELGRLLFVVVSETIISSTLARVPNDAQVVSAVREVVADHAADEGRHHAYFAAYLTTVWEQMTDGDRTTIAPLLPQFVRAFLTPDFEGLEIELVGYGLSGKDARTVLAETYQTETLLADARTAAADTLRYFERCGAFNNPAVLEAFGAARLTSAPG